MNFDMETVGFEHVSKCLEVVDKAIAIAQSRLLKQELNHKSLKHKILEASSNLLIKSDEPKMSQSKIAKQS